jgi:hypothetical protein
VCYIINSCFADDVKLARLGHRLRLGWELTLMQFCFVLLHLGGFQFTSIKRVLEASDNLYRLLLETQHQPEVSRLNSLINTLAWEFLVYSSTPHKIDGPCDFILML